MYNLIIDIGNTTIKLFLFENSEIVKSFKCSLLENIPCEIQKYANYSQISRCIVSSVREDFTKVEEILNPFFPIVNFNSDLKLPIKILYETPNTLGSDRIAAVVGANTLFSGKNVLVIDAGTAITYDILTANAEYLGGNISPGIHTRYRSLNNFTQKLPLLDIDQSLNGAFGRSTTEAITLGVQNGIIYEVCGTIKTFENIYKNLTVVFTGGDCFFFENKIKNCNFAVPNLLAIGLNKILEYNAY